MAQGEDDRGRRGAVAPVERDGIGVDPVGADDRPADVDRAPSTMLDDENTRPGGENTGAGLLMATVVSAKVDSP